LMALWRVGVKMLNTFSTRIRNCSNATKHSASLLVLTVFREDENAVPVWAGPMKA
jgi:hypothetical protein